MLWLITENMKKRVKVKPNSKVQSIKEEADGSLTVSLKSPPVEGKANQELIKLLAEKFVYLNQESESSLGYRLDKS